MFQRSLLASLRRPWVLILATLTLAGVAALMALGHWLVVEDPLKPAHAIVVLGGHVPFRAIECAELYWQRQASEVWLTRPKPTREERALAEMEIGFVPEYELSRRVLDRRGVPAEAIRVLEPPVTNTQDEMKTILHNLNSYPGARVIVVTSKVHTRRVRMTWRLLGGQQQTLVVRFARRDPFDPARWWANTDHMLATVREVGGIVNAWFGFVIETDR